MVTPSININPDFRNSSYTQDEILHKKNLECPPRNNNYTATMKSDKLCDNTHPKKAVLEKQSNSLNFSITAKKEGFVSYICSYLFCNKEKKKRYEAQFRQIQSLISIRTFCKVMALTEYSENSSA